MRRRKGLLQRIIATTEENEKEKDLRKKKEKLFSRGP